MWNVLDGYFIKEEMREGENNECGWKEGNEAVVAQTWIATATANANLFGLYSYIELSGQIAFNR
jgi:hypothetical protein